MSDQHGQQQQEKQDGRVMLKNPNIAKMESDFLYHFALSTNDNLPDMFGDVKFVVVGGSPRRMEKFAHFIAKEINCAIPAGQTLTNISSATDRYALYKVGPVLIASHGIGIPSISICLNELIKLMYHAKCTDKVIFFRMGTSGGLGMDPGTVVISDSAVDACLNPYMEMQILDKKVQRPSVLDKDVADELVKCGAGAKDFQTMLGKTMCTLGFYEGQGRLDGAFCDYTEADKMAFLHKCHKEGIRNIEMESLCFAAMCHHAGIRGAVCCVTIVNRLKGDQIDSPPEELHSWDNRPAYILARFIRKRLGLEK